MTRLYIFKEVLFTKTWEITGKQLLTLKELLQLMRATHQLTTILASLNCTIASLKRHKFILKEHIHLIPVERTLQSKMVSLSVTTNSSNTQKLLKNSKNQLMQRKWEATITPFSFWGTTPSATMTWGSLKNQFSCLKQLWRQIRTTPKCCTNWASRFTPARSSRSQSKLLKEL